MKEHPIYLILDSGSSGSIISKSFLEKLNRPIEAPSHINMIDINGGCTRPLGKVTNIPIQLDGVIVPINVDVSESKDYFIVAGNDWITDVKGILDWHYGHFTFNFKNQYHRIAITCWDKPTYDQAGQPQPLYIPEDQEIGDEYEDE